MTIVISTTTIPSRVDCLERSVQSLVNQGLPVYVWLPRYVERINQGFEAVPGFLKRMDVNVSIVENLGPATKLLYAIQMFDTVITGDDDRVYGEGWARDLVKWAEKHPDTALGYRGRIFAGKLSYGPSKVVQDPTEPVEVDIITSVRGTLYHRRHLDDSVLDECEEWPHNDDIVFGGHLWQRGVSKLVIPRNCRIDPTRAHHIDPLFARKSVNELYSDGLKRFYEGWSPDV